MCSFLYLLATIIKMFQTNANVKDDRSWLCRYRIPVVEVVKLPQQIIERLFCAMTVEMSVIIYGIATFFVSPAHQMQSIFFQSEAE